MKRRNLKLDLSRETLRTLTTPDVFGGNPTFGPSCATCARTCGALDTANCPVTTAVGCVTFSCQLTCVTWACPR